MKQIDQLELYDIYELWHVPFWQKGWFKACIAVAIVLCFLYVARWFYRRFIKKKPLPVPPWQQALAELKKLQEQSYTTKDDGKLFYFKITDILKRYLAARFHLDVESKTDQELVAYLNEQEILPFVKERIADIAQGCVFIKFAGQEAMQEQIKRHLESGIQLVTHTIPQQ